MTLIEEGIAFIKAALSGFAAVRKWRAKRARPRIEHLRAPENFFDHVRPGLSAARIRELLGAPHRVHGDTWQYRFSDLLVEIMVSDTYGATSVAVGLVSTRPEHRFRIPGASKPLGLLMLSDVLIREYEMEHRSSLRHEEIVVRHVYGPSAIRERWVFGALSCAYSRVLCDATFRWDHKRNRVETDPHQVLINWVAIAGDLEAVGFDWSLE